MSSEEQVKNLDEKDAVVTDKCEENICKSETCNHKVRFYWIIYPQFSLVTCEKVISYETKYLNFCGMALVLHI